MPAVARPATRQLREVLNPDTVGRLLCSIQAALFFLVAHVGVPAPKVEPVSAHKSFLVNSWSVRDGLPPGAIESLLGLRDGYLVVAQGGCLSVFDGTTFRVPCDLAGLESDNAIRSLFEDSAAVVWSSTTRSSVLRWLVGGLSKGIDFPAQGISSNVAAVCQASENAFWLATTNGLVRLVAQFFVQRTVANGQRLKGEGWFSFGKALGSPLPTRTPASRNIQPSLHKNRRAIFGWAQLTELLRGCRTARFCFPIQLSLGTKWPVYFSMGTTAYG